MPSLNVSASPGSLPAHSLLCFGNLINPNGLNNHLYIKNLWLLLLAVTFLLIFRFLYQNSLHIYTSNPAFPRPNSSFLFSPKKQSFLLNPNSVNGTTQSCRHLWFFPHPHLLCSISSQTLQIQSLCVSHIALFFLSPLLSPQFGHSLPSDLPQQLNSSLHFQVPLYPKISHIILTVSKLQLWSRASQESWLQTKLYTKCYPDIYNPLQDGYHLPFISGTTTYFLMFLLLVKLDCSLSDENVITFFNYNFVPITQWSRTPSLFQHLPPMLPNDPREFFKC